MQVHYLQPKPPDDQSGVTLKFSADPPALAAGIMSFATWFTIPARLPSYAVQNTFCYQVRCMLIL